MKELKIWGAAALLSLGTLTLSAQNTVRFEGEVLQQAALSGESLARLSSPQLFGTARSMAMANAFASLGGDLAAMSINPAGLGMYRHNELSITPLVSSTGSTNNFAGYGSNSKTRFSLANIGVVYNLYEGTGRVVSLNMGLGYNRVADLNYCTSFQYDSSARDGKAPSILDVMAGHLTVNGLYPDGSGFLGYYGDSYPDLWGAMMAYNSYLINPVDDPDGAYWEADHVGANADVGHFYNMESRGSVGEYDLAFGLNIDNKIYVGATVGIQSISQRVRLYYGEDFRYGEAPAVNGGGQELIEQVDYLHYNQSADRNGVGINFKLGIIYRPMAGLRIGVALHTPTYYSLDHRYAGQMASMSYDNDEEKYYPSDVDTDGDWTDSGSDAWRFSTPARLMFGISYAFGQRGIVSVDYERDWYNGIRVKQMPFWIPDETAYARQTMKNRFRATNTLRIGAELKPFERWALRAGFGYTSSMVRDRELLQSAPVADRVFYCTAGTGFALSRHVSLDLAYQYCKTENASYRLFYAADREGVLDASEPVRTDYARHAVSLSLGVKF